MPNTKQHILEVSLPLILENGLDQTGLQSILEVADVPKGSFYHYFESKEAFAIALLDYDCSRHEARFEAFFQERLSSEPFLEAFKRYVQTYISELQTHEFRGGCLLGNLAQYAHRHSPAFTKALQECLNRWKCKYLEFFQAAQTSGELKVSLSPESLVTQVVTTMQGAFLHAKITQDLTPFDALFYVLDAAKAEVPQDLFSP
jgi:TetR/AcrR family transcriptional regulator, transcriptional repressor for nem operon